MHPDESRRVLVYCLEGQNMLGWRMYNWLWECIWLYDNTIFGSSLPFYCLLYVLCVWFYLFAKIINLLVWVDARNTCGQQGGDGSAV